MDQPLDAPKALVQRILEKPRYSVWKRACIRSSHDLFRQVAKTSANPEKLANIRPELIKAQIRQALREMAVGMLCNVVGALVGVGVASATWLYETQGMSVLTINNQVQEGLVSIRASVYSLDRCEIMLR